MIRRLEELVAEVKASTSKPVVVVACGEDPHTIEAVAQGVNEGLIKTILVGDRTRIEKVAQEHGIDPGIFEIRDVKEKIPALWEAVRMVREREADFLMKGLIDSAECFRAILDKEQGLLPPGRILSHVTAMEFPRYHKLLIFSDPAVILYPDLAQKVQMVEYTVQVAHSLGIERPKVAIIAPIEKVNPKMQATLDAACIAKMAERGQIKGCVVDGPLALDVAVSRECAEIKGISSEVAGDADILIFPNIESGNVFFKTATQLSGARPAAVLVGTQTPCIFTSRADSPDAKFYSIALGAKLSLQ